MTFSSQYAWVIVALVLIAGALVRYFYNERHSGRGSPWWAWVVAALAIIATIGITIVSTPSSRLRLGMKALPEARPSAGMRKLAQAQVPRDVDDIVTSRCSMCHMAAPVWRGFVQPPKGIRLDTPAEILRHKPAIQLHSVLTDAMPPNNITAMTKDERRVLAAWVAGR